MKIRYKGVTYRTENLNDKEKELMAEAIKAEAIRLKSLEEKNKVETIIEKPKQKRHGKNSN